MGGMLSKQRIEQQLEHFKDGCPWADPGENEIWILALEWVLGDERHREAWVAFIADLDRLVQSPSGADVPPAYRAERLALSQALERLR